MLAKLSQSFVFPILAAPGVKIVPTAAGVVISQGAQVYQPHIIAQPAVQVSYIFLFISSYAVIPLYEMHSVK